MIRRELGYFLGAVGFFTRLPVPGWVGHSAAALSQCARYFPAVGLLVGGIGALVYWLALHLWPQATGLGVDRSTAALGVAQGNAGALGLAERAAFKVLDWHRPEALDTLEAPFDLLLCNPPYVETGADLARQVRDYEPAGALFAGSDGMDDYRHLMPLVPPLIGNSGVAIFELGAGQYPAGAAFADAAGLLCDSRADLGGHLRALLLRSRPK